MEMNSLEPNEDPGWPLGSYLKMIVNPFSRKRMSSQNDGLTQLRYIFIAFVAAAGIYGLSLTMIGIEAEDLSSRNMYLAIVITTGLIAQIVFPFLKKTLAITDEKTIGGEYRTRFFLRIAIFNVALLLGFMGAFSKAGYWPFIVAIAFTYIGFFRLAPTKHRLETENFELQNRGWSGQSLTGIIKNSTKNS